MAVGVVVMEEEEKSAMVDKQGGESLISLLNREGIRRRMMMMDWKTGKQYNEALFCYENGSYIYFLTNVFGKIPILDPILPFHQFASTSSNTSIHTPSAKVKSPGTSDSKAAWA